jgi:hypothetical protein
VLYLLHFERPISAAHTTQHYIGFALDLAARLAEHRAGRGARLTQVAIERGISFEVVRVWPGDRNAERALKNRKAAPRLCPCCNPYGWHRSAVGAEQLAFDLVDLDPFDVATPATSFDGYEWCVRQSWRGYTGSAPGDTSTCDIPY